MKRKFLLLLVLLLISSISVFAKGQSSSNLRSQKTYYYETDVSIIGVFDIEEHYYDATIRVGEVTYPYFLFLSSPIKVVPSRADDEMNLVETGVNKIQLAMDSNLINKLKSKKAYGKKIKVTGELYHSYNAHHFSEVLMSVKSVEVLD